MSDQAPESSISLLTGYYRSASERLRDIVLHPPGRTEGSQEFRRARAATQLAQIRRITRDLGHQSAAWTGREMTRAYREGRATAERQAKEAGVRGTGYQPVGSFHLIDKGAVSVVARDTAADLAKSVKSMGAKAERLLRETQQNNLAESDINKILAGGLIEGTPRETIRSLREEFARVSDGGWIEINGRTYNAMLYAEMVARTRTREATVVARHERLSELGLDLVRIIGRVSNNFCTAYLGQVFSISGDSDKYPPLSSLQSGGPPFHPNCTKSTAPYVEELATETQAQVAEGVEDAAKLFNKTPADAQRAFNQLQLRQQIEPHYGRLTPIAGNRRLSPRSPAPAVTPEPKAINSPREARRELERIDRDVAQEIRDKEQARAQLTQEIDALDRQVAEAQAAPSPNVPELNRLQERQIAAVDRLCKLDASMAQVKARRADRGRQVLAVARPVQVTLSIDSHIRGDRRRTIQDGAAEFARLVGVKDAAKLDVKAHGARGGRSYYVGGGIYMGAHAPVRTVVHELGHALEDVSPTVHQAAVDFLKRRTAGEPLRKLRDITGIRGYRNDEVAREDKFIHPYMGKDYGGRYTEIISMGLEHMWADPFDFAQRDPDYFDFIFKLMRS